MDRNAKQDQSSWLHGPSEFLDGATSVFHQDADGLRQFANWLHGDKPANQQKTKPADVSTTVGLTGVKSEPGSLWRTAGQLAGSVVEFAVVNEAIGALAAPLKYSRLVESASRTAPMWQMAGAGAITSVLKPVDSNSPDFGTTKLKQAGLGFGTMLAMGGTSAALSEYGIFGRVGHRTFTDSILANSVAGAAAGGAHSVLAAGLEPTKPLTAAAFGSEVLQGAAFGGLFGVAEGVIGPKDITIKPTKGSVPANLPSTEDFVAHHYDASKPLTSPILSWIAENRPELRPQNYEALREQLYKNGEDFDFGAWSPEQRVQVVHELRRMADSSIANDSNIDGFIAGLKAVDNRPLAAYNEMSGRSVDRYRTWVNEYAALEQAKNRIAPDAQWSDLVSGKDRRAEQPQLKNALERTLKAEQDWKDGVLDVKEQNALAAQAATGYNAFLGDISRQAGVRPLTAQVTEMTSLASYFRDVMKINAAHHADLNDQFVESLFHENRHHLQGSFGALKNLTWVRLRLDGKKQLGDYATEPYARATYIRSQLQNANQQNAGLDLAQSLSDPKSALRNALWGDNFRHPNDLKLERQSYGAAPMPDKVKSIIEHTQGLPREEADQQLRSALRPILEQTSDAYAEQGVRTMLNRYVGYGPERQAYSSGVLANIRARAWGLPVYEEPAPEPAPQVWPENLTHFLPEQSQLSVAK